MSREGTMAPWDSFRLFDTPRVSTITNSGMSAGQLVGVEPRRVVLIMSTPLSNGVVIGPMNNPSSANGGYFLTTQAPLELSGGIHGPLVQAEWWHAGLGFSQFVYVIELLLREWPEDA